MKQLLRQNLVCAVALFSSWSFLSIVDYLIRFESAQRLARALLVEDPVAVGVFFLEARLSLLIVLTLAVLHGVVWRWFVVHDGIGSSIAVIGFGLTLLGVAFYGVHTRSVIAFEWQFPLHAVWPPLLFIYSGLSHVLFGVLQRGNNRQISHLVHLERRASILEWYALRRRSTQYSTALLR